MRTHITVVGLIQIISGLLRLLVSALILFGGALSGLAVGGLTGLLIGGTVGGSIAILLGAIAVLRVIAGYSLLRHRSWARYAVIILSLISLFRWWAGSVIGAYSLWVLFNRETEAIFAASSGA